ncbi:helix-turn-helix domain-containing protein, partial [Pseudomonas aeruginosa]
QAKRLLLEERPLAELAQHHGFYDPAHISTTLRRFTGVTPGQFRRSAQT